MKTKFSLNLLKVKKENDFHLYEKMKEIEDSTLNIFMIKILLLKNAESTTVNLTNNQNLTIIGIQNENEINSHIMNNSSYNSFIIHSLSFYSHNLTKSTFYDTQKDINIYNISNSLKEEANLEIPELKFNSLRAEFCLKNKIYDIPLSLEILNYNHPPKYRINNDFFAYLYPNEPKTYCITITRFIAKNEILNNDSKNIEINKNYNSKYNFKLGLYFCGKNEQINIGNKNESKICKPDEFICKQCMKLNKTKYNLKKSYLVNICGRVTKINKGSYHCFGHFLLGNQIEQCITRFSCDACKNLNHFSEYYI